MHHIAAGRQHEDRRRGALLAQHAERAGAVRLVGIDPPMQAAGDVRRLAAEPRVHHQGDLSGRDHRHRRDDRGGRRRWCGRGQRRHGGRLRRRRTELQRVRVGGRRREHAGGRTRRHQVLARADRAGRPRHGVEVARRAYDVAPDPASAATTTTAVRNPRLPRAAVGCATVMTFRFTAGNQANSSRGRGLSALWRHGTRSILTRSHACPKPSTC